MKQKLLGVTLALGLSFMPQLCPWPTVQAQQAIQPGEVVEFFFKSGEWHRGKILAVNGSTYRIQLEGFPNTYNISSSQVRPAPPIKNQGEEVQMGDYVEIPVDRTGRGKQWVAGRIVEIKNGKYKIDYGGPYHSGWFETKDFRNLKQDQQQQQSVAQGKDFRTDLMPYQKSLATLMALYDTKVVWSDPRQSVNTLAEFRQVQADADKAAQVVQEKYASITDPAPRNIGSSLLSAPGTVSQMLAQRQALLAQLGDRLLKRLGQNFLTAPNNLNDTLQGKSLQLNGQNVTWAKAIACGKTAQLQQVLEASLNGYIREFKMTTTASAYLPGLAENIRQRQAKINERLQFAFSQKYKLHVPTAEAKAQTSLKGSAIKMGFASTTWEVVPGPGGVPKGRKLTGAAMWKLNDPGCNLCAWDRFLYWEDHLGAGKFGNGKIMWDIASELIQCQR